MLERKRSSIDTEVKNQKKKEFLAGVGLFAGLPEPTLRNLSKQFREIKLPWGDIVNGGQRRANFFVVWSGQVTLLKSVGETHIPFATIFSGGDFYEGFLPPTIASPYRAQVSSPDGASILCLTPKQIKGLFNNELIVARFAENFIAHLPTIVKMTTL